MEELFDFEINPQEMLGGTTEENTIETETPDEDSILETTEETTEDPVDDTEESGSDGVKIFYDFVVENGIIDELDNFDGSIDSLKQELESLPAKSFRKAVSTLPEIAQQVVNYVFSKDGITIDDFKDFIQNQVEPAYTEIIIDDVESARTFLGNKYKEMGIYSDDEDMQEAIDLLEEKGTLLKTAKQIAEKTNSEIRSQLENNVKQLSTLKEETERVNREENKKLVDGINQTLNELSWHDTRKNAVIENLKPEVLQKKNEAIRKSYKAIVQLADLYSYFDETKGEFDFSKLIDAKASSKQTLNTKSRMQEDKFSSAIAGLGKQLPNGKEKSILEVVEYDYDFED